MLKSILFIVLLAIAAPAAHADASAVQDRIVRELRDDGYTQIRVNRTLLGRLRFLATQPGSRREIVINPATGVILRDYIYILDGDNSSGSGGSSASGGGDDDDDGSDNSGSGSSDSGDDDDDGSDNSGPGSSSSGSGSDDDD